MQMPPSLLPAVSILGLGLIVALNSGCGERKPETTGAKAVAVEPGEEPASGTSDHGQAIQQATAAAESGAFDDAAAQLLRIQAAGQPISPKDAAAYRSAMSDAYSRALEAAEKGDPKAKAALEMLKAARNR